MHTLNIQVYFRPAWALKQVFIFLSDFLLYNYSVFWCYRLLLYYGKLKIVLNRNMHFAFCWTEIKTLITDSKMENPTHSFRETNLCFSSYRNCKLKVKLISWSSRKKKKGIFSPFILSSGIFSKFVFHRNAYWTHLQNIHTFCIAKNFTSHFSASFYLKSSKAFSVSLTLSWMRSLCEGYSLDVRVFHDKSCCSPKSA